MTTHTSFPDLSIVNKLAGDASDLGYEIVDLAGFLDLVDQQANSQRKALADLAEASQKVRHANGSVQTTTAQLHKSVEATFETVETSVGHVRDMGSKTRDVATWVQGLGQRTDDIAKTLQAVKKSNGQIATIALQVNTLAINAKIEAARAGDMGRGFAVVAEAINELSMQTKSTAQQISENVEELGNWLNALQDETKGVTKKASAVLATTDETDKSLAQMQASVAQTKDDSQQITAQSEAVHLAMERFLPGVESLNTAVTTTSDNIKQAHSRIEKLVDTSERLVQGTTALGGTTEDGPFITYVKESAQRVGQSLEDALAKGEISEAELFTRTYKPIAGTDPEQVMAPFTTLIDKILPPHSGTRSRF